jgi:hypothetical protein
LRPRGGGDYGGPMKPAALAATALAASLAACTFEPEGAAFTLRDQLAARAYLDVAAGSGLTVDAIAHGGQPLDVAPAIEGGQLVLRATEDGYALAEDLELPLSDVTIPAGVVAPTAVRLTELSLRLGTQLAVEMPSDDAVLGWGTADLLLDWSMVDDRGVVVPLAVRRIPRARFTLSVSRTPALHAALSTRIDGTALELADAVTLRDLALDVAAD